MNRAQLISALAKETKIIKADITAVVDAFEKIVPEALKAEGELTLPGLGKLFVKDMAPRKGRNPFTGESIDVPASKRSQFKPFGALKKLLKQ